MKWCPIKLGDFLTNRDNRYKPKDKSIAGLKRIDKIDFSGNIFLSEKPSNTDMILIKKGDLVISGINVEKGAMAVYEGKQDVTATIHYSSYKFNIQKIDIEFLKYFLKSREFKQAIKEQVPGGIKTEIKPKHLLPLTVNIPSNVSDQRKIISEFKKIEEINNQIGTEFDNQLDFVYQLRQSFLREAMQGKLVPQDKKDGDARDLLKKLKAEKAKSSKKEKSLPEIKPEEIPFEIPGNWVWCRLLETGTITGGGTPSMGNDKYWNGNIPWVSPKDMKTNVISDTEMKVTRLGVQESTANMIPTGSLLIVGRSGILKRKIPVAINVVECTVNQDMKVIIPWYSSMSRYLQYMFGGLESIILKDYVKFGMTVHSLKYDEFSLMPIPLPPSQEQKRIEKKLDELMKHCDNLESSIQSSKEQNEMLLQVGLREVMKN